MMRWLEHFADSMRVNLSKRLEFVHEGQGSLARQSPRGRKGSDMT